MGLILGPRGKSLEEVSKRTNCQIIIRGKGTLKSGMTGILKSGTKVEAIEEPMHALIKGQTAEDVKKAVKEIEDIINLQVYQPESEKVNVLKFALKRFVLILLKLDILGYCIKSKDHA